MRKNNKWNRAVSVEWSIFYFEQNPYIALFTAGLMVFLTFHSNATKS